MRHIRFALIGWRTFAAGLLAFCLVSANVMTIGAAGDPVVMPTPVSAGKAALQSGTTLSEFPIPTPNSGASNITNGPDGNFWFTETNGNKIGQVTADGVFKEFPLPAANSQPFGLVFGPDFNLWFTEQGTNKIGTMTLDGTITEFSIPTANSKPFGITSGSDDALWFTENTGNKIGRISTSGNITEFVVPTANCGPFLITSGPDGNLWFTERTASKLGRITPAGVISEFATPTANSGPEGITAAFDGNIWFTEKPVDKIGVATTSGSITEIPLFAGSDPTRIAAATDGSLLVTEQAPGMLLKITPSSASSAVTTGSIHIQTFFGDRQFGIGTIGVTFLQSNSSGFTVGVGTGSNKTVILADEPFASQIEFTKMAFSDPVAVGDTVTYRIHVKNNSPNPLSGLVDDVFDASALSFLSQASHEDFDQVKENILEGPDVDLAPGQAIDFVVSFVADKVGTAKNKAFLLVHKVYYIEATATTTIIAPNAFLFNTQPLESVIAGQPLNIPVSLVAAPQQQSLGIIPQATNVNLTASVAPATSSITTSFSANPVGVPGSTTLNVNTTSSTPAGTYSLIITGTAGSVTHRAVVTLLVSAAPVPDFSLGFDSPTVTAQAGTKARVIVNINRTGGFTGGVTVTPPFPGGGIKPKPPDPISTTDPSVVFKFKVGGGVSPGQYPLTFTAQDAGNRTRTGTVTLVVQ